MSELLPVLSGAAVAYTLIWAGLRYLLATEFAPRFSGGAGGVAGGGPGGVYLAVGPLPSPYRWPDTERGIAAAVRASERARTDVYWDPKVYAGAENWAGDLPKYAELEATKHEYVAMLHEPTGEWDLSELREVIGLTVVEDPDLGELDLGDPEPARLFAETSTEWVRGWLPAALELPDDETIQRFVAEWAFAEVDA